MRIPLYAFYNQPDFLQRSPEDNPRGYPVFSAVVPFAEGAKMGRGYRIYKLGPGDFEGTYQIVTYAERQEDGAFHWIPMGEENSLGAAVWTEERGVWTCENDPPDVEAHRASMDSHE